MASASLGEFGRGRKGLLNSPIPTTKALRPDTVNLPARAEQGRCLALPPILRHIIGQPRSTLDLSQIMNGRRVLIANLSKSALGEGPAHLIGAFLATAFAQAAEARASIPEAERIDFYLYVDEFQNFGRRGRRPWGRCRRGHNSRAGRAAGRESRHGRGLRGARSASSPVDAPVAGSDASSAESGGAGHGRGWQDRPA